MTFALNDAASWPGAAALGIGRVTIAALTRTEATRQILSALAEGRHLRLAFANAHVVNLAAQDHAYAEALRGFLVLPDGIGVDLGSRILSGRPFPANLNGTDFIPHLLASSDAGLRVGLIGARPGVAERAAESLRALCPHHAITVFSDGYFDEAGEASLLVRLERERPDLLLVAFGNPRQELWIADRLDVRHAGVAAGVGALFDFLAGEAPRAPGWMRAARLEWLFRLALEPGRLWRRYVLGNPAFLARVLLQSWQGRP